MGGRIASPFFSCWHSVKRWSKKCFTWNIFCSDFFAFFRVFCIGGSNRGANTAKMPIFFSTNRVTGIWFCTFVFSFIVCVILSKAKNLSVRFRLWKMLRLRLSMTEGYQALEEVSRPTLEARFSVRMVGYSAWQNAGSVWPYRLSFDGWVNCHPIRLMGHNR